MINPHAIVIGAGVVGCGIAYELARTGWRVTVVDAGTDPGSGSTSASSAIVRFNYSTWTGVVTAWESALTWLQWRDYLRAPVDEQLACFHAVGGLLLDSPGYPFALVNDLMTRAGVELEVWSAQALRGRLPVLDAGVHYPPKAITDEAFWREPDGELGAVFTPGAGFVDDPQLAARNLADAARRGGATFRFRSPVTEVLRDSRVRGVALASGERLYADVVIGCAGPWSSRLIELAGVAGDLTLTMRPMRQEVHHVTAPQAYRLGQPLTPFVADPDLGTYFRPTPGDGLLVGGLEPACDPYEWLTSPEESDPRPTARLFEAQVLRTARRMPDLAVPGAPKGLAGVYDVSDDWAPVYDRTCLDGFYLACGTSGNQFKNAPVIGRLLRTLVEQVEGGQDHDRQPVRVGLPLSGHVADLGDYSRKRELNTNSSFSVLG